MLDVFKLSGKDKISKAINSITSLVKDLEEGIKQTHLEKNLKKQELTTKKKQWEAIEKATQDDIQALDEIAQTGAALKQNIANLLKGKE